MSDFREMELYEQWINAKHAVLDAQTDLDAARASTRQAHMQWMEYREEVYLRGEGGGEVSLLDPSPKARTMTGISEFLQRYQPKVVNWGSFWAGFTIGGLLNGVIVPVLVQVLIHL